MAIHVPRRPWIWLLWLAGFYSTWAFLVFGQGRWDVVREHWPIALAMAMGSYVAGSTPMGGGTVGFPILVLLFDLPAQLGRDFSFAVQSIGMTSASIFILAWRQPVAWSLLRGSMLGALVGTPLGVFLVAPLVPPLWIKLLFAVVWASFGVFHLYRVQEIADHDHMTPVDPRWSFKTGVFIGFLSAATVAAVTGVGIDMVIYAVLVLLLKADLKIAVPTSVLIMAFTSIVGILTKVAFTGVQPGVFENWLAAAPVVALGAPLGAYAVNVIGRKFTLRFVALLCVGQYFWTVQREWAHLGGLGLLLSIVAIGAGLLGFEELRALGSRYAAAVLPGRPSLDEGRSA